MKCINYEDLTKNKKIFPAYLNFIKSDLHNCKTILAISLTFKENYKVSHKQAMNDGVYFHNIISKSLYGKCNGKNRDRVKGCLVVEGNDYDDLAIKTHIHGILGFDLNSINQCKSFVSMNWSKLMRAGCINEINVWDGEDKWIEYLLKQRTKCGLYSDSLIM